MKNELTAVLESNRLEIQVQITGTGPAGRDGRNGSDGKDGYTPIKGVDYFDGAPGKDGAPGRDGLDGKDGAPGRDGQPGKDGLPGPEGPEGKQGPEGPPGSDATVTAESIETALGFKPASETATTEIKRDLTRKLTEPESAQVGQFFRVASIDADGHYVLEAVDAPSGGVGDVTVNGISVVSDGVAAVNVPITSAGSSTGIEIVNRHAVLKLTNSLNGIKVRRSVNSANDFQAIVTSTFDQSVKHAMCDEGTATGDAFRAPLIWSDSEQAGAQRRVGFLTMTQEEYDLLDVKGASTYYFIVEDSE